MYHFRIKSDKRTNGSITNAVSHIKYINREDEYADVDSKHELANQHFSENIISGQNSSIMPELDGMEMLYKSPFGSIIGRHDTICISDNPSPTTIDIAVTYAYKQSNGILNIKGTPEFKAQVILCAADLNLDLKFYDQEMQESFEKLKEEYNINENLGGNNYERSGVQAIDYTKGFNELEEIFGETEYNNDIFEDESSLPDESELNELFAGDDNIPDESELNELFAEDNNIPDESELNEILTGDNNIPNESFDELFAGEDFGGDDFPDDSGEGFEEFGSDDSFSAYSEIETDNLHEPYPEFHAEEASAASIPVMHIMQGSNMDSWESGSEMLLPDSEEAELRNNEEGLVYAETMRRENAGGRDDSKQGTVSSERNEKRNISIARINRAEKTVMQMIFAANGMIKGADHVAYINREEQFASRGGCVYTDSHLPSWARDAKDFFEEADKNERINGTRYKEIELALPNELTLEQQKEIISEFISHHLSDFYYAYAVHDKIGALSNEQNHPHVCSGQAFL